MNPTKIGPFQYGPLTLRIDYMPGQMRLGHEVRYSYGCIPGTAGADGDALDVFLGPNPSAPGVTIIDQIDPATGEVDEHKVGLGFSTADEALAAYRAQWGEGRDAGCVTLPMDDFAAWVDGEGVASAEPFDLLWTDFDSRAPLALRKGAFWRAWCGISKSRRDAITKGPDSHTPPADVRAAAKRGLALREKHGKGGLSTQEAGEQGIGSGVARARDLASGGNVSTETLKRMVSFFARHRKDKSGGEDDAGYISWLLWGGDPGEAWAKRELAKLEKGATVSLTEAFFKGAGVEAPADEAKWDRAKKLAADEGHTDDWAYIQSIYQNLKGIGKASPSPARDIALRHVAAAFRALQLWGHGAHLVAKGVGFVGDHVTLLSDLYEFGEHSFDAISERAIGLGAPDAFAEPLGVTTDVVKCLSAWPSVCCDESTIMANAAQVLADTGTALATQTKVIETTGEMTRGLDNLLAQLADDIESLGYKFGQRNKSDAPVLNLRADIATAFGLAG